jgi:hypothetical protein
VAKRRGRGRISGIAPALEQQSPYGDLNPKLSLSGEMKESKRRRQRRRRRAKRGPHGRHAFGTHSGGVSQTPGDRYPA